MVYFEDRTHGIASIVVRILRRDPFVGMMKLLLFKRASRKLCRISE
jgi:hypothetical protein